MKRKLQVFISSTFSDLIEERQAAVAAILKAGHIPAGMELFTAGDKSQMQTIERWIDESDVYMLILGGRYGTIEKISGISYTELEYDYAKQNGKTMFAVVTAEDALNEKVKNKGVNFMERENPKELKIFREKVLSNISSFFSDGKDIRLCVHESLADLSENRDLKGWISAEEIEDHKTLQLEIKRLRDENSALKESLEQAEKLRSKASLHGVNAEDFEQLISILGAIQINIPVSLANGKETTRDLLSLFYRNKDYILTGVTNSNTADEMEEFTYHNICPKLQTHGLADNEKVVGVRYRRSYVTKLGISLLSYLERKELQKQIPTLTVEDET
ncbi:MAG: hypothetical protein C0487_07200 [Leptothrix sp. (in: Bacteria)]|nr:hypothetical protein [Leptothrix sp. (in: b-proteobacteria)]